MKKKLLFVVLMLVLVLSLTLAACNKEIPKITFVFQDTAETSVVVDFDDNFEVPQPTNGKKAFDGWYLDAACTEGNEWNVPEKLT